MSPMAKAEERVALPQDMSHLRGGARQRLAGRQLTGRLSQARNATDWLARQSRCFKARSKQTRVVIPAERQRREPILPGGLARRPHGEPALDRDRVPQGADSRTALQP